MRWLVLLLWLAAGVAEAVGPVLTQSCQLQWQRPTMTTDGAMLGSIDHYLVYVSQASGMYRRQSPALRVSGNRTKVTCPKDWWTFPGQYYAVVVAVTEAGQQSSASNEFGFILAPRAQGFLADPLEPDSAGGQDLPTGLPVPRPWQPHQSW